MNQNQSNHNGSHDMLDVSNPDVAKMSPAEIQAHIDQLLVLKAQRQQGIFDSAIEDINNIIVTRLQIAGVSNIHELSAYLKKDTVKSSSRAKQSRTVSHYWQHRQNPQLRWAGRGQIIGWLRDEMIKKGKDPSDKAAVRKYCDENLDYITNH